MEELINQYMEYKGKAIWMDFCTLGINLCILIVVLLQANRSDKKIKWSFIIYISTIVLSLISEILAWHSLFNKDLLTLYKVSTVVDYMLLWFMPATMFHLIRRVVEYKVKFNNVFSRVFRLLFIIFGLLMLIPPFRDLIIIFNDDVVGYKFGPLNYYYFLFEDILMCVGIVIGLINSKKIGVRDTIIGSVFILVPTIYIYLDYWWASTIGLLFSTFALIFLFGITYQKKLVLAREQEKEKKIELADTKMKLLLTQIQPHFLYNTLTTLKYLCETNPEKASSLCDDFSHYLRSNIDAANDDGLIPFEKELGNIESYLKIEQARFDDRVKYVFDIQVKDFIVPVLAIQTIVENAVKKGICAKAKGGTIHISTRELDGEYQVVVKDDGVGFDLEAYLSDGKNHIGLINTRQRLEIIGGTVAIDSKIGEGTVVTCIIPKGED